MALILIELSISRSKRIGALRGAKKVGAWIIRDSALYSFSWIADGVLSAWCWLRRSRVAMHIDGPLSHCISRSSGTLIFFFLQNQM